MGLNHHCLTFPTWAGLRCAHQFTQRSRMPPTSVWGSPLPISLDSGSNRKSKWRMPLHLHQITRAAAARPFETTPMAVHSLPFLWLPQGQTRPPPFLKQGSLTLKGPAEGPGVGTWTRPYVLELDGGRIEWESQYI